ncbi:ribose 5-phosphate isomerase A-domain-containing protein [Copromyces sp. CBS 386.78]|nr:ribose 5-phosphate isomerase A-domain-containing protein [Copromyces sp. CBS 386.78]
MKPHRFASLTARRCWSGARPSTASFIQCPSSLSGSQQRPASAAPAFHSAAANHFNPSTSSVYRPVIVQRSQTKGQSALHNIFPRQPHINLPKPPTAKMSTATTTSDAAAAAAALIEESKRLAAFRAVKEHLLPTYTHIGIGSGSTVVHVVSAISALPRAVTSEMTFYPTGAQSEALIEDAGLRLAYINKLPPGGVLLDVCFDGADEVDSCLNLIKGGGACLWQEKIVATAARKFVCVADFRKISDQGLGTQWTKGIPIEVLPMAAPRVLEELKKLGSLSPKIRPGTPGKAGAIVTDNGLWIVDAPFKPLLASEEEVPEGKEDGQDGVWTVDGLADRLIKIPGVAEIGLFYGQSGLEVESGAQKPVAAYFGMADGSVKVQTLEKGLV